MDAKPNPTLDEQLESVTNAKKAPLWQRLIWLVVAAGLVFMGYTYRGSVMAWISRTPVSADTAAPTSGSGGRGGKGAGRGNGGGATAVAALPARKADMPHYLRGLGSASPYATVTVKTRVDGQLLTVAFKEGLVVQQGDLLAQIDSRPFEVQLAQAQGQLAQARGLLARDQAQLQSAQMEAARNQQLLDKGLIAKQEFDMQRSTVGQYAGATQADQAGIEVAQGAIANANLQISYCRITAPITGRIGLRLVDPGNIVHAGDPNGLAVIAQVQPIAVLFNIPEDNLNVVLKKLQAGEKLQAEAYDRDDQTKLATGTLLTVDNQIDQSTGTSRLKAVFDNANGALFPNQFVNVHLLLEVARDATIIPAAAIQRGPQGTYVYVVDSEKKAHIRVVTLKNTEGSDVSVGPELQPGELIIVEGADKVQDGGNVDVRVAGVPNAEQPGRGAERGNGRGGRGKRSGQ